MIGKGLVKKEQGWSCRKGNVESLRGSEQEEGGVDMVKVPQ